MMLNVHRSSSQGRHLLLSLFGLSLLTFFPIPIADIVNAMVHLLRLILKHR